MPIIRIALLLVVVGGLTLLLVQNWFPNLPLVFLGMTTQPLPLVVWILISLTAGAFTSLLLTALSKLSNYFAQPNPRKRSNAQPKAVNYTAASRPASNTSSTSMDASDD